VTIHAGHEQAARRGGTRSRSPAAWRAWATVKAVEQLPRLGWRQHAADAVRRHQRGTLGIEPVPFGELNGYRLFLDGP
jgi:hypothetical protein